MFKQKINLEARGKCDEDMMTFRTYFQALFNQKALQLFSFLLSKGYQLLLMVTTIYRTPRVAQIIACKRERV